MASIIKSDNGVSSGITGIVQSADSSGQLALQTTTSSGTATTAVTIDNTQKVTFANSIGFGSNAGITFNNSSALTNSTLNDYEIGTWTPTFASTGTTFTYSTHTGYYTKIGNSVILSAYVNSFSISGTLTNPLYILGLPFASKSGASASGVFGVEQFTVRPTLFIDTPSTTELTVYQAGSVTAITPALMTTSGFYLFTITYFTA